MDWLTFISNVIAALAWPVATIVLVVLLRKQIVSLLPFIKRLKAGPLEAEFEREVKELKATVQEVAPTPPLLQPPQPDPKDALLRLSSTHPRAAILEAWLGVEGAAIAALERKGMSFESNKGRSPLLLASLLAKSEILAQGQLNILQELRSLRNQVVHVSPFEPTEEAARSYVESASYIQNWLEASGR